MTHPAFLKPDSWLGDILSKPSFNLNVQQWFESEAAWNPSDLPSGVFIQSKVSCDQMEPLLKLQDLGFKVMDTNVTFSMNVAQPSDPKVCDYDIEFSNPKDESGVRTCANNSFIYTRYHLDPKVSNDSANKIKSDWAGNYFLGKRGDHMVVARDQYQNIAGFCQLLQTEPDHRVIDLIAVGQEHRKRGLAQAMIYKAMQEQTKITVGTQVSNIPSIRCYEKMGFQLIKSQYVLHYHGSL